MFFRKRKPKSDSDEEQLEKKGVYVKIGNELRGPYGRLELNDIIDKHDFPEDVLVWVGESWQSADRIVWDADGFPVAINDDALSAYADCTSEEVASGEPAEELPLASSADKMISCPHCWHRFPLSRALFIAKHTELVGDPVLGADAQVRFLPTSFDSHGYAIDAKGMVCEDCACPRCHLRVPTAMLDIESSIFSIVGAPGCGKSYYLTSMIWKLRRVLAQKLDYILADTDENFNAVLNSYESILFLNRQTEEYVALPKTELQGNNFSSQIMLDGMRVDLPLPFLFTLTPVNASEDCSARTRNLIFYDNAGEQFEPGRDLATNPATAHLVHSDSIVFMYDPLKDARMASHCDAGDPQIAHGGRGSNQLVILNEMIARIRKYAGLKGYQRSDRPLIVVIPKYDAWRNAFPVDIEKIDVLQLSRRSMQYRIDIGAVADVSWRLRSKLMEITPEVVATCEAFSSIVYFIPVSAIGSVPGYDREKDMIAVKPGQINPIWVEVPALVQLAYAGVISAVDCSPRDCVPVEDCKFSANAMTCILPGAGTRIMVPLSYCGRSVFSEEFGGYIRFPEFPKGETVAEINPDDGEFWQQ